MIVAESLAPAASVALAAPAATPAVPAAITVPAALAAPAIPAAPAAPAAPAIPAAPVEPRVFGKGMAAINEQDNTEYRALARMNVVCSHCGALHWIEVMISVTILFTIIILYLSIY